MTQDDDLLIDQAMAGESDSLEKLLGNHLQGIFNVCFRICWDTDDANDCVQNTCMKIMKHLSGFKKESAFRTWTYRIAYNESIHFLQSRKEYVDLETVEPYLGKRDTYDIDGRDMESLVRTSINELSPIDKSIILFYYYDDLKIREIAKIMDMNENTVKTRMTRSKAFLQPLLEPLWKHL